MLFNKVGLTNRKNLFIVVTTLAGASMYFTAKAEIKLSGKNRSMTTSDTVKPRTKGQYAWVNGLKMYYEVHGSGRPIILLHGGISTIDKDFSKIIPVLSKDHRVIAIELQGHGHTPDVDRLLNYEFLANDVLALLEQLKIKKADFCGYSLGGGTILQLAIKHPGLVGKMILISTAFRPEGYNPGVPIESLKKKTLPEINTSVWKKAYLKAAPDTSKWSSLVFKIGQLGQTWKGWTTDELKSITSPALLIFGDADLSTPNHAAEMFSLFGGGPSGDFYELPGSELAILPGTAHTEMMERTILLIPIITKFLNKKIPENR
jgi:pimeloyl-ACP methyl ester carboxylesterase